MLWVSGDQSGEIQKQIQSWYTQWILVDHLYAEFAQSYGISSSAMYILRMLLNEPEGCTQRCICDYLTLPKQTVSSVLKTLEEAGYVVRRQNEKDRRNRFARLTDKGAAFIRKVTLSLGTAEEQAFKSLSENERSEFTRVNEKLTKALQIEMQKLKKGGGCG